MRGDGDMEEKLKWYDSFLKKSSKIPEEPFENIQEIKHPLSEGVLKVDLEGTDNLAEKIKRALSAVLESLPPMSNSEKKAFYIWRNLPDRLAANLKEEKLAPYLFVMPASAKFLDVSIWEHLKVSSALYSDEKLYNSSLFLFTIGPVQSFISQARKTQDFYLGSFILSYLTFVAMKEVIEQYGPTSVIYPDMYKQPLMDWYLISEKEITGDNFEPQAVALPTIPNRFVAIIGTCDDNEIKHLAKRIEEKVRVELLNVIDELFEHFELDDEELRQIFEDQFKNFPEIYWAAVKLTVQDSSGGIKQNVSLEELKDFFSEDYLKKWGEFTEFAKNNNQYFNIADVELYYQPLYTTLEKVLRGTKNVRRFEQFEETGRKCSICGERNALFFRKPDGEPVFVKNNLDFFYRGGKSGSYTKLDRRKFSYQVIRKREGLCAVCFLKRTFHVYLIALRDEKIFNKVFEDFTFPPTSEIAFADFKEMLLTKDETKKLYDEYVELFKAVVECSNEELSIKTLPKLKNSVGKQAENLEGTWLYIENLTFDRIKEAFEIDSVGEGQIAGNLGKLREKLNEIYKALGRSPNKYYALIYLDGDEMGKWLAGEKLPSVEHGYAQSVWQNLPEEFRGKVKELMGNKILTPATHSAISVALRNYTIEFVRKIVEEEHLGKLVYAGGDDVLAFVNLRDLFDVIEKLRWAFSGQIEFDDNGIIVPKYSNNSGFVLKDGMYHLTMGPKSTCSVGVVIAHYREHLKIVVDKVFKANSLAKESGRNRFAITLLTGSGRERTAVCNWLVDSVYKNDSEDSILTTRILKELQRAMDNDEPRYISNRFVNALRKEFERIQARKLADRIVEVEIKRLVERAYNSSVKESSEERKNFVERIVRMLIWLYGGVGLPKENKLQRFADLLEIVSFMNRGD